MKDGYVALVYNVFLVFHYRLLNIERRLFGDTYAEQVQTAWESAIK